MEYIEIEMPENGISFNARIDWRNTITGYARAYNSPDKFPCIGIPVMILNNLDGPDEQVWGFVYPKIQQ